MGLNDGLVALWHFSNNLDDSVGSNDLTNSGTTSTTDKNTQANSARDLDGSTQYMYGTVTFDLSKDFTFNTWMTSDAYSTRTWDIYIDANNSIRLVGQSSGNPYYMYYTGGGTSNNGNLTGFDTIADSSWYMITMTYNVTAKELKFYKDTVLVATHSFTTALTGSSATLTIGTGNTPSANYHNGKFDECRIYSRKITDQEVIELYVGYETDEDTVGTLDEGLEALYHFTGDATDSAGSNTLTVNGASLTTDKNSVSNQAYTCNSTNDSLDLASTPIITSTTDDWSISGWAQANAASNGWLIQGVDSGGTDICGILVSISANIVRFQTRDASSSGAILDITRTSIAWHHYAMSYSVSTGLLSCYIDGGFVGTISKATTKVPSRWVIGNDKNLGNNLPGGIDEVRLYNRAITQDEVWQLYFGYDTDEDSFDTLDTAELYYSLDDADNTGSDPDDISGNGNDGTTSGATTGAAGILNEGFSFDGTNDVVSADSIPTIGTNDMSISCWFYDAATSSSAEKLYWFGSSSTRASVGPFIQSGAIKIGLYGVGLSTTSSYSAAQWNNVVIVLSGGNDIALYLNGDYIGSDTQTYNLGSTYFYLGDDSFSAWFLGGLDEPCVYSRALTPTEILKLWGNGDAFNPYAVTPTPSGKNNTLNLGGL